MNPVTQREEKVRLRGWEVAEALQAVFREKKVFVVNLIGSPGAGKTSLLEAIAPYVQGRAIMIVADPASNEDKRRIERAGIRVYQINTGNISHLDAGMVREALKAVSLDGIELIFIENVGNLVCPASFEIGEDIKVAVVSVTEGEDKPAKYPKVIQVASAFVITKTDLLPHVECDVERMQRDVHTLVSDMPVFATSARTGEGVRTFLDWIERLAKTKKMVMLQMG